MGCVYAAVDLELGRRVAIKVLPPGPHGENQLLRFRQEARAAGSLNHPNVLTIFDLGTSGAGPYIVSELLEGETLRARMQRGRISPAGGFGLGAAARGRHLRRAREGHRASRPQAREPLHHRRRPAEGPRLRHRQVRESMETGPQTLTGAVVGTAP